jgi:hypothetical protein
MFEWFNNFIMERACLQLSRSNKLTTSSGPQRGFGKQKIENLLWHLVRSYTISAFFLQCIEKNNSEVMTLVTCHDSDKLNLNKKGVQKKRNLTKTKENI